MNPGLLFRSRRVKGNLPSVPGGVKIGVVEASSVRAASLRGSNYSSRWIGSLIRRFLKNLRSAINTRRVISYPPFYSDTQTPLLLSGVLHFGSPASVLSTRRSMQTRTSAIRKQKLYDRQIPKAELAHATMHNRSFPMNRRSLTLVAF